MMELKNINEKNAISVRRIKELAFFINETLMRPDGSNQPLKLEVALGISFKIDLNLVFILVRVYYHYPDSPPSEIITDIQVQNVFEIEDLKKFLVNGEQLILPQDVIITLVGISYSHTRALFAKNISGTIFQDNLMTIVSPIDISKHFFPYMFNDESSKTANAISE
jgi:hypothetical protein